jgi:hypothetical protein
MLLEIIIVRVLNMKPVNSILSSIFLIILLLIGCELPDSAYKSSSSQFFPLAVGNKWYYNTGTINSSSVNEMWEITGTRKIADTTYYILLRYNLKSNIADTSFYRCSSDTLFYRSTNKYEHVAADFSLHLNDTTYWDPYATVTERTEDKITFSAYIGGDSGYGITYIKGIGVSNMEESGFVYYFHKLVRAEIK